MEVKFDRNVTDNMKELSEIAYTLSDVASRETILSLLPFVNDAQDELEKIRAEKLEADELANLGNIDVNADE